MRKAAKIHPTKQPTKSKKKTASGHVLSPTVLYKLLIRPRKTIQAIVRFDSFRYIWILAALMGVTRFLNRASIHNLGDTFSLTSLLLMAATAGPLLGIAAAIITGKMLYIIGKQLKGKASEKSLRAAFCWSSVPIIFMLPIWIMNITLMQHELFTTETPIIQENLTLQLILFASIVLEILAVSWSFMLLIKTVAAVQIFTGWKGFLNVLLVIGVYIIPVVIYSLA